MKRLIAALCVTALCVSILAGCGQSASGGGEAVSVEAVSSIAAGGSLGLMDRYAGMVVAGETAEIQRDSNKTIGDTFVKEGDMVKAGDVLFSYDMEKMQLDLENLRLEKQREENSIVSAQAAIAELENERAKAKDSEKLSYTLQIDTKNADIRESQYNIGLKDRDIANLEASLGSAEVVSPISGRVMSVAEEGSNSGYYYDESGSSGGGTKYITITDVTSLRVEGNINEMNAGALMEGMPILVRSRLDSSVTWTGTLSMIDWEHPVNGNNNNSGGMVYIGGSDSGDDEMTTSSKYPFYVELTDIEGLMLGQHVYIEPDTGGDTEDVPAGPMIPSYYICYDDGGEPFVWAAGSKDKLEKRSVTLGVYDEEQDLYEIAKGLTLSDYIAFPVEGLEEGRPTEKYDPSAMMDEGAGVTEGMTESPAFIG